MLVLILEGEHDVEELIGGLGLAHDEVELALRDLLLHLDGNGPDGGDQHVLHALARGSAGGEDLDPGGHAEGEAQLLRGQGVFFILLVGLDQHRHHAGEPLPQGGPELGVRFLGDG